MDQFSEKFICPKCKSARVLVEKTADSIKYYCENSVADDIFCNWMEIDQPDDGSSNTNDNPQFLSTFLFDEYSENKLKYEHLYLMGEKVKLSNMTTLAKKGNLQNALSEKILELYPEWKNDPMRNMFYAIKKELQTKSLEMNGSLLPHLVIGDFIPDDSFIRSDISFDRRLKISSDFLCELAKNCHNEGDVFIFTQGFFRNGEYIPLTEELMLAINHLQATTKEFNLILKRYILLPNLGGELIQSEGYDTQAISILHLVSSQEYYYDKIAIVEPSFWKKWEFGSRNAPYNPFGKDPGSFWVRTSLSKQILEEMEGKTLKEQSNIINRTGQEKFEYIPLNMREAIARCILLGSLVGSSVVYVSWKHQKAKTTDLHREIEHVVKKLHRKLTIIEKERDNE